jgi:hypothetical protein
MQFKLFRNVTSLVFCFFLFGLSSSKAQTIKSFPSDSIEFFNAMETFLVESRKEGKNFMKQFEDVWYGGYFSESQRKGVYSTTNKMLKKKLRAFPDFRNYLFTVGSFVVDTNQTEASFATWQGIIDRLLEDRRKKKFTEFLNFCNSLFRENAIYSSASTTWAADNNNYVFGFDSLPKITFENLDLKCFAKRDSMKIMNTKGSYYPTEGIWYGYNGIVTWERAGLLPEEVYGKLASYQIETRKSDYVADSVIFYNNFYLNEPLVGKLTNKLLANMTPERASYPKFDSYDKRVRIENISPGVNFDAGFSMLGSKLLARGDNEQDAKIEFIRNDTLFLVAKSESFSIRTDKIVSTQASIRIYLLQDSISHPGLNLKYLIDKKLVTLYKENQGVAVTPYSNSFHDLEMNFEVLNWKADEPILTLTNLFGGTKTDATFTSADYFKEELFEKIGGLADVNPLFKVHRFMEQEQSNELSIKRLGYHLGLDYPDAKNMVIYLSTLGFADFDMDEDLVIIKEKLTDFVLAKTKKIDYDVINVYSDISGMNSKYNAKINLLNNDLTINGVEGIVVSDSQKVVILPAGGQIKMKRNRFFEFSGQIKAGRFDFYGKKFSFDYEQFKINLDNTDSLRIQALSGEKDREGKPLLKPVKTVVQNVNGDLLIDNVFNKSGLKDFPEYPILNSKDNSYVFYDKKEILNGVYKKADFYFEVDPFTIDSLDNFSNDQLKFDGTFSSGKIFPTFREQLTLQPDFSLGFVRETPPSGYPMYGGKGQFFDKIKLSHDGLRGDGSLKYVTSTTYSKDFIFYPDSMRTLADRYEVEKTAGEIEFPPVKAIHTKMRWLPNKDIMYATTTDSGMVFYDKTSRFWGTSSLTPRFMSGDGVYKFSRADLTSNKMYFKYNTFDADTADFVLKDNKIAGAFALKTRNLHAHVDYKGRFAEFKANGKAEPIEFPINQYLCYMEEFKWYMDNDVIDLKSSKSTQIAADVKLEGSKFVSTHPDQDSLFFYAPLASYDSRRHVIKAKEVLFINTADSRVYPDSGTNITIEKKANMQPLVNSKITTNSVTEYHSVYQANTKIFGRKSYYSSGFIDYIDKEKNVQPIYLSSISVDTTGQTVGIGEISDTIEFNLSPYFSFDGKAKLYGSKQFLVFDGLTKIKHACTDIATPWVKFESEIDPENIFIPVDTATVDSADGVIVSSISLNVDSNFLYSSFMSGRSNYSDIYMIPTYGFLNYKESSKEYIISSKEKIAEPSLTGNYLRLNTKDCIVYGNGKIDIGARTGNLKFNSAGNVSHDQKDNSAVLDLAMTVDFFFDDNATKKMADDINENINLNPTDFSRETFLSALKEIVGVETADEMKSQMSLNGKLKRVPEELNKRLFLNDIKFKWVEDINSFKSFGKIGVSNIGKEEINKYLDGKVMITKKRSGDIIDIYLEIDPKNWYYFSYRRGLMKVISSNEDFNNQIKELKKDKRKYPAAKGEKPFSFMFGSDREKRDFERDFESEL